MGAEWAPMTSLLGLLTALLASDGSTPPVTLLVAGDVTLGYHYEEFVDRLVASGQAEAAAAGWGFDKVALVTERADLFLVNLECPFTRRGEKLPKNFNCRARPELVEALARGGVDVVSLANNHLMDWGEDGLVDTLATLDAARIRHFGAGRRLAEARKPVVLESKGVKVAFLGYFFLGERNIEPREVIATEAQPGVAGHFSDVGAMKTMLEADIRAAKALAQHVVPFFHWGREGQGQVEPYQIELAHAAIDAGASAVVGSHPHVLQGVELYRGAPIAYSLGNFVFGGNWDPKDKRAALLELTFAGRGRPSARLIPVLTDDSPTSPMQPFLAPDPKAGEILSLVATLSADFPSTLEGLSRPRGPLPDGGVGR